MAAALKAAAIVVAAGFGTRMGTDKLWADLAGVPVLLHSLLAVQAAPSIDAIVVVTRPDRIAAVRDLASSITKLCQVCPGGPRRQDSVRLGLELLDPADYDVVAVHDGARPLVESATIEEGIGLARARGAAVAAVPAIDTIKRVDVERRIVETPPRAELWSIQTPQVFRSALLRRAHAAITVDVTDDAAMVEALGEPVWVYAGSRRNIKITTAEDLVVAQALLRNV